ncbi:xylose isomerase [Candidatus Atribacteria bacterium HGW-Atribacteria-1]|nr:MAG: xylose isomerase [Candidatus Atribacteria bacterium HGW-Atribacteria-1]
MGNIYPKLHNSAWAGLVGKGPDSEPPISLDEMIAFTANSNVNGQSFDGMDVFLFDPHIPIDASDDELMRIADKFTAKNLKIGTVVAPVWEPTGGGSAIGDKESIDKFLGQLKKGCHIAKLWHDMGVRPYGAVRIDSACGPSDFLKDPKENKKRLLKTFREAIVIAEYYGEKLVMEGEICWGGMHSWKHALDLLVELNSKTIGFQADLSHMLLFMMGYNAEEYKLVKDDFNWEPEELDSGYYKLASILRPFTYDIHVAQNDGTVHGSGSHDKTGRHCSADDPNGKLDIVKHTGYWLCDEYGPIKDRLTHLCWDGVMFPNALMEKQQTWNTILATMLKIREKNGWR